MPSTPLPERLRFAEFTLDRLPNGRCRARVGLTWKDSEQFTGEGEGLASQAGELRCSAQACVMALGQAVQGGLSFELLGVKAVRAFDSTVVIVSLAVHGEGPGGGQRRPGNHPGENREAARPSAVGGNCQERARRVGNAQPARLRLIAQRCE